MTPLKNNRRPTFLGVVVSDNRPRVPDRRRRRRDFMTPL